MIKRIDFQDLWKRRKQIIEGYFNRYLNFKNKKTIQDISNERLLICRSNICGLYDKDGTSELAYVKGAESCGGCGCMLAEKTSCLSCDCYLAEINQVPLWTFVSDPNENQ